MEITAIPSLTQESKDVIFEGMVRWGTNADPFFCRVVQIKFRSGGSNFIAETRWYDAMGDVSWRPVKDDIAALAVMEKALCALEKEKAERVA